MYLRSREAGSGTLPAVNTGCGGGGRGRALGMSLGFLPSLGVDTIFTSLLYCGICPIIKLGSRLYSSPSCS